MSSTLWRKGFPALAESPKTLLQLFASGELPVEQYLAWASEEFQLPLLASNFFELASNFNLLLDYPSAQWNEHFFPVNEWNGIVYIACLEPQQLPQEFSQDKKHCFVLGSPAAMVELWNKMHKPLLDEETQPSIILPPPAVEDSAPLVEQAIESEILSAIDAPLEAPVSAPPAVSAVPTEEIPAPVAAPAPAAVVPPPVIAPPVQAAPVQPAIAKPAAPPVAKPAAPPVAKPAAPATAKPVAKPAAPTKTATPVAKPAVAKAAPVKPAIPGAKPVAKPSSAPTAKPATPQAPRTAPPPGSVATKPVAKPAARPAAPGAAKPATKTAVPGAAKPVVASAKPKSASAAPPMAARAKPPVAAKAGAPVAAKTVAPQAVSAKPLAAKAPVPAAVPVKVTPPPVVAEKENAKIPVATATEIPTVSTPDFGNMVLAETPDPVSSADESILAQITPVAIAPDDEVTADISVIEEMGDEIAEALAEEIPVGNQVETQAETPAIAATEAPMEHITPPVNHTPPPAAVVKEEIVPRAQKEEAPTPVIHVPPPAEPVITPEPVVPEPAAPAVAVNPNFTAAKYDLPIEITNVARIPTPAPASNADPSFTTTRTIMPFDKTSHFTFTRTVYSPQVILEAPGKINETKDPQEALLSAFKILQDYYKKLMWVVRDQKGYAYPIAANSEWAFTEEAWNEPMSFKHANPFRIAKFTQKPFHGPVHSSPATDAFFKNWNGGKKPEFFTVVPIMMFGKVFGYLVGCEKGAHFHPTLSLEIMESTGQELLQTFIAMHNNIKKAS